MSQVQAQTKDLALLWRFAQPPLRYRRPKRILAIRERTPPSVWCGGRVQLPAEVSQRKRITPRGFAGKPQMSDEPRQQIETRRLPRSRTLANEAPDRFARTAQTLEAEC